MNKIKKYLFEIIALLVMIGITSYTSNKDNMGYNQIMNISGILYVFSARRIDWFFPILGLVFASMYASLMLDLKILGEAYFNAYVTVPFLLIGLYQNLNNIKKDKIHVLDRKINNYKLLILCFPISFYAIYQVLTVLKSGCILLDAISTTFALFGTVLLNLRYNKCSFFFWSCANFVNLILHLSIQNWALSVVYLIYLINGLLSFKSDELVE